MKTDTGYRRIFLSIHRRLGQARSTYRSCWGTIRSKIFALVQKRYPWLAGARLQSPFRLAIRPVKIGGLPLQAIEADVSVACSPQSGHFDKVERRGSIWINIKKKRNAKAPRRQVAKEKKEKKERKKERKKEKQRKAWAQD